MTFDKCEACPLGKTCNLVKEGIQHQCSLYKDQVKVTAPSKTEHTHIVFESDMKEDSLEETI